MHNNSSFLELLLKTQDVVSRLDETSSSYPLNKAKIIHLQQLAKIITVKPIRVKLYYKPYTKLSEAETLIKNYLNATISPPQLPQDLQQSLLTINFRLLHGIRTSWEIKLRDGDGVPSTFLDNFSLPMFLRLNDFGVPQIPDLSLAKLIFLPILLFKESPLIYANSATIMLYWFLIYKQTFSVVTSYLLSSSMPHILSPYLDPQKNNITSTEVLTQYYNYVLNLLKEIQTQYAQLQENLKHLTKRQLSILKLLKNRKSITRKELSEKLNVSWMTIYRDIKILNNFRLVEFIGQGKSRKYAINQQIVEYL